MNIQFLNTSFCYKVKLFSRHRVNIKPSLVIAKHALNVTVFNKPPFTGLNTLRFIKGCKQPEVYGTACDKQCPIGCKGNTCHIQSGACLDCEHGVYGGYCNLSCPSSCKDSTCNIQNGTCMECLPGVYGRHCNQSCPNKCKDRTCHFQSGICLTCESGWAGTYCNTGQNIDHMYIQDIKQLDYLLVWFFFYVIIYELSLM